MILNNDHPLAVNGSNLLPAGQNFSFQPNSDLFLDSAALSEISTGFSPTQASQLIPNGFLEDLAPSQPCSQQTLYAPMNSTMSVSAETHNSDVGLTRPSQEQIQILEERYSEDHR